ncbi:NAD(P)H-quinone oxidoreductase [Vulgatibacter sp.]|uniref:NAD(P)H-quinone oxidoreductase n=1 Tax=Vulgatibacter sp. TaxID=1971226 RepID=UPI00356155D2
MPTIRALCIREAGETDVLELQERQLRDPGPGEILVRVAAAGVNRADVLQRRGFYPAPPGSPPDIPGLEYAGTVEATGDGVSLWKAGDAVMGIVGGGAMASHLLVHEREAMPAPPNLSIEEAAAIPEVFLTAWDALFLQAGLRLGERVLLHAVASGIGTAALQLALHAGAIPIGTSRSREKLDRCAAIGLRESVLVEGGAFARASKGANVILDTVGAAYATENAKALSPGGRWVMIGLLGGATGEVPLGLLLSKRAHLVGSVLRSRPLEEKAALARAFSREIVPLFTVGKLRPVVDAVLPIERAAEAHERMERNETFGKLVLTL